VTVGKGFKWKAVLNAVRAVDEMKSQVDTNPGDSDDSPTSAGGGPSLPDPSDDRSPESQGNGNAHAGKAKWKTALTSVKTANGLQRHLSETKQGQQPEDHTADFVGLELWDFLCETAELIFVPQKQRELIFSYATPFYNRGMRSGHLVEMGKAIESVFRHTLPFDQYGEKQRAAWKWLWSNISHTLGHELDVLEKDWNVLVLESWQLIQQRADVDALGQDFWKRLNDISPDQTHVFRRPLKMWGHLLHHIVNTLILSISSPDTFFDQIFQLTVRHIRYGVRPHYLPPFGQAVMETFEHILQEQWTAETHQAWQELWKRAADSMMRGLNFGGSPLVHALVDGSVDHLRYSSTALKKNHVGYAVRAL
jgi:hemoglobin-like flavoprotein